MYLPTSKLELAAETPYCDSIYLGKKISKAANPILVQTELKESNSTILFLTTLATDCRKSFTKPGIQNFNIISINVNRPICI